MVRRVTIVVITAASWLFVTSAVASPISLVLPQSIAFSLLGHSCGGIQEQSVTTGFDATSGYPAGDVYMQTRCGGSGRGGGYNTTTYSRWASATWDYTGAVVSFAALATGPTTVDPTFTAFDASGNEVYDQVTAVNGADCSTVNTTSCSYHAYLLLASGFVPPPRVTGISVTSGPASGGTSVTITGTGLTGATDVSFGGTPAAIFTVNGDTSIGATSPAASAGTVDVTVTTAGGTSAASADDQFTFVGAPSVSGISPDNGPIDGGTLVTITGASFVDVGVVYFGETPAGFTVDDDSSITAVSPPGEALDTVHVVVVSIGGTSATSAADRFTYTPSVPTSFCGDGTVDPGEDCDDGAANGQPGDCCSFTCVFQAAGTDCADDGSLCTADLCDGAGTCVHPVAPSLVCTPPDVTEGASLLVRTLPLGGGQVKFKWGKGPVVSPADLGDPTAGEQMALCIYDQAGSALVFGGSPSTSDGGVWTITATGWKFKSTTGLPDGITNVTLKSSTSPLRAKMQVTAPDGPPLGSLPAPGDAVIAELKTSQGACWGASFSTPQVSTATEFKAKSD